MIGRVSKNRRYWSLFMKGICYFCLVVVAALALFMFFYVLYKGVPKLVDNPSMLVSSPSVRKNIEGILPNILNTLYIVVATLVMVLPIGVGAAIYLTEYAKNRKMVRIIEFASETLSGIPSIIYGLVGMLVFVQFFGFGTCLLAGAMTLVVMNLPTIMSTTQESLKTVPQSYREGAFALGAGKWRVIRTVVLPTCINGIITGCILTVGRILGESAALLFTAGLAHKIYGFIQGLESSGATLTVALYIYASERGQFDIAYAIAAILMILTLLINLLTVYMAKLMKKGIGE